MRPGAWFVLQTWMLALLATVVLSLIVVSVLSRTLTDPIAGTSGTDLGILTIVTALCTFVGFALVTALRLRFVDEDRMENGLAVGVLHTIVGVAVLLALVLVNGNPNGMPTTFESTSTLDQIVRGLAPVALAAPFALVGCLIAIGIAPAPDGTPPE